MFIIINVCKKCRYHKLIRKQCYNIVSNRFVRVMIINADNIMESLKFLKKCTIVACII